MSESPNVEIVCTQENLAKGLQVVSRVATTKSSLPILANIHLQAEKGQLTLAATDLEIGVTTTIGAKVKGVGAITLPARLLVDCVTATTDETLTLSVEGTQTTLSSERYKAVVNGMDAAEFPLIPSPGDSAATSIPAGQLKAAVSSVLFAAALDDARPVLNGVLLRVRDTTLTLAATDSYRLAERVVALPAKVSQEQRIILPARAAAEIVRILPDSDIAVQLIISTNQVALAFEQTRVVSRLIEGSYPDYTEIIPKEASTTVTALRGDVIAAVRMASLFARDVAHHIRLKSSASTGFSIQAVSSSVGQNTATVPGEVSGDELEIAFNAKYLLDALNATPGDTAVLKFLGTDRPVVVQSGSEEAYLNLVMPLRLDA